MHAQTGKSLRGEVVRYDATRGFGFIHTSGQQEDIFVHISAVQQNDQLAVGQSVTFDLQQSEKGPRAVNVRILNGATPAPQTKKSTRRHTGASPYTIFSLLAVAITLLIAIPLIFLFDLFWLLPYLIGVNLSAFALYGYDKRAAQDGRLRVPERVLFGVQFVGGTLGPG